MAASTPSLSPPSKPGAGTNIILRPQNPTITINGKQYKITQIQMRKAGETAWHKVELTNVNLNLLAEKCQQVFENAQPTQEELSKLSFIFRKDDKPDTPLILREIKYLRNHASEMESVEVKVTLDSQIKDTFVNALFHPNKQGKVSPPANNIPPVASSSTPAKPPLSVLLNPESVLEEPIPPQSSIVEVID